MRSTVYFIADDGKIKIGYTANIRRRIADFRRTRQLLEIIGTIPGSRAKERELHQRFAPLRVEGEWFLDTRELRAAIAEILAQPHVAPIDRDFDDIGRALRAAFAGCKSPADEMSRITGINIRSCYRYMFEKMRAPERAVRLVLRNEEYGQQLLLALMDGCTEPWWLEMQELIKQRAEADRQAAITLASKA